MSIRSTVYMAAAGSVALVSAQPSWKKVLDELNAFPLNNFCFSAGIRGKQLFEMCKGNTTMDTELLMASSSKFPSATAIMGVVSDPSNDLTLDSKASDFLDYWTTDPSDSRSGVTLRHMLTFTSGYYSPDPAGSTPCMANPLAEFDTCVQQIYEQADHAYEAGTTWDYNSFHLQLAGGMAAAASGRGVHEILTTNVLQRLNMSDSMYLNKRNPALAAGLITTGHDYEKFLQSYLAYELVDKELADQMENDVLAEPGVVASEASEYLVEQLGHYGMAHYIQCLIYPKPEPFPQECVDARIHADPGLFGYWPLVDRKNDYYINLVQQKIVTDLTDLWPTTAASLIMMLVKPQIDRIIRPDGDHPAIPDFDEVVAAFHALPGTPRD